MMPKLSNQAILRAHIDSYCLVCEAHFKDEKILDEHILQPEHKNNLNTVGFVDNYKDHLIRKVKKGYFCEFCNELLHTTAKLGIHLDDPQHINKKGAMLLKRVGGNVVAFGNLNIDNKAWNGIIDKTCVLCNKEFNNAEIHNTETSHKLNLVQYKTEFGTWGIVYRKIDDDSFQCLPCNKVFSTIVFGTHFDTEEHKQNCLKTPSKAKTAVLVVNKSKPENKDADAENSKKTKTAPKETLKKRPLRPQITSVDIQKPFPVRAVSYEYESLVCNLLKTTSYTAKLDKDILHCILCEKRMTSVPYTSHIQGPDHQYLLKIHKKRLDRCAQIEQIEFESEILDSLERFELNNIKVDLIKGTAECNLCFKELGFAANLIDEHIDYHKERIIVSQLDIKKKCEAVVAKYEAELAKEAAAKNAASQANLVVHVPRAKSKTVAKHQTRSWSKSGGTMTEAEKIEWTTEHNINFNNFQNMAYCNLCNTRIPMSVKNLKEHLAGNVHKKMLAESLSKNTSVSTSKPKIIKVPTKTFVKSFMLVENMFYQYFVINKKFVISYKSMSFLGKTVTGYLTCFLCGDDLVDNPYAIEVHRTIRKHCLALDKAEVITSLDTEFVREISSGKFHCGYCNNLQDDWNDLQNHFNTVEHKESRTSAKWRLKQFTKQ